MEGSNTLTIRRGLIEELPVFAGFWLAMFEEIGILNAGQMAPDWRDRFERYFSRRIELGEAAFFVAVEDEVIAGTAGALVGDGYPFAIHGIARGYIFGVRVAPEFRRRGVAATLTGEAVGFLRDAGCKRIRLHASPAGRATYERLGFTPTNEMEILA